MRDHENIQALLKIQPEYLGYILYRGSERCILEEKENPPQGAAERVGVFVNASEDFITENILKYSLTHIQLHGEETAEACRTIRKKQTKVIKAFSIDGSFDFSETASYSDACDYFLFDTKGKKRGGNGLLFDWNRLEEYKGETPFFLSGGIGMGEVAAIKAIAHPKLEAIDINSRFEIEPGLKDITKVKTFIDELRSF